MPLDQAQEAFQATVADDYLMYLAPGSSQYVPLAHFVWNTDGSATIPSTGNWASYATEHGGSDAAGSITPNGSPTAFLQTNSFPMWTQNSGNDAGGYF